MHGGRSALVTRSGCFTHSSAFVGVSLSGIQGVCDDFCITAAANPSGLIHFSLSWIFYDYSKEGDAATQEMSALPWRIGNRLTPARRTASSSPPRSVDSGNSGSLISYCRKCTLVSCAIAHHRQRRDDAVLLSSSPRGPQHLLLNWSITCR